MFEGPSSAHNTLLPRCNRSVVRAFWTISDRFHQERDRAKPRYTGVPRGWQKPERRDPHCPWQNGKMERFDRTLQTEGAYRQVFTTDTDRTHALAP
jgi:hypothetical protein